MTPFLLHKGGRFNIGNILPLKGSKKFPQKNMGGIGYVWACGIRNGDGGGRIVPLKAGIG